MTRGEEGEVGMGAEEEGGSVCQTPVMLLLPAPAPPQLLHVSFADRERGAASGGGT